MRAPIPGSHLPKIKEAREAIAAQAKDIYDLYIANAKAATAAGEYEAAAKCYQYLIDHMPPDSDGKRMVDPSIDKGAPETKQLGPQINIGFQLGGVNQANTPKELPPHVIDVEPEAEDE